MQTKGVLSPLSIPQSRCAEDVVPRSHITFLELWFAMICLWIFPDSCWSLISEVMLMELKGGQLSLTSCLEGPLESD
jgi:hypothetical protein